MAAENYWTRPGRMRPIHRIRELKDTSGYVFYNGQEVSSNDLVVIEAHNEVDVLGRPTKQVCSSQYGKIRLSGGNPFMIVTAACNGCYAKIPPNKQ